MTPDRYTYQPRLRQWAIRINGAAPFVFKTDKPIKGKRYLHHRCVTSPNSYLRRRRFVSEQPLPRRHAIRSNAKAGQATGKSVSGRVASRAASLRYASLAGITLTATYLCYPGWFG